MKRRGLYNRTHRCCMQHLTPVSRTSKQRSSTADPVTSPSQRQHAPPPPSPSPTSTTSNYTDSGKEYTSDLGTEPFAMPHNAIHQPHPPATPWKSAVIPRGSLRQLDHLFLLPQYDQSSTGTHKGPVPFGNSSLTSSNAVLHLPSTAATVS